MGESIATGQARAKGEQHPVVKEAQRTNVQQLCSRTSKDFQHMQGNQHMQGKVVSMGV